MSDILEEPPDENETFENLDESLDDEDALSGGGPEGRRDIDSDMVVDQAELEEVGANLDDPEKMSILDGGMDDPDGVEPSLKRSDEPDESGWDVDPVTHGANIGEGTATGADGDTVSDDELLDVPEIPEDPELEEIPVDPSDLDRFADDSPGPDSARW